MAGNNEWVMREVLGYFSGAAPVKYGAQIVDEVALCKSDAEARKQCKEWGAPSRVVKVSVAVKIKEQT